MPDLHTRTFELKGLLKGPFYCIECAQRLCGSAARLPGVIETSCDIEVGTLVVGFDPAMLRERELAEHVERLAHEASGSAAHAAYRLTGLD